MSYYGKNNFKSNYGSSTGPFANSLAASVTGLTLQQFATDLADSVMFNDSGFNPDTNSFQEYDYLGSSIAPGFTSSFTAGGSVISGASDASNNSMGYLQLASNTGFPAYVSNYCGYVYPTKMSYTFAFRAALPSLSDGTNTYTARIGICGDTLTPWTSVSEFDSGYFFRYTHSVNGGRWQCVTRFGGSETATDSATLVVAGSYNVFQIYVNQAASSATFYINGNLIATNTLTLPTAASTEYFGWKLDKSAGATANYIRVDWHAITMSRSSAR